MEDLHALAATLATDLPYDHWELWESFAAQAEASPRDAARALIAAATTEDAVDNLQIGLDNVLCNTPAYAPLCAALVDADPAAASQLVDARAAVFLDPARFLRWHRALVAREDWMAWETLREANGPDDIARWDIVAEILATTEPEDPHHHWVEERLRNSPWARDRLTEEPPEDMVRAVQELDALERTIDQWRIHGRDPTEWLLPLGRLLPGCFTDGCCGPGAFERELMRRGYYLRQRPPLVPAITRGDA